VNKMSCQDVFDLQGTPTELQKTDGVFPDCLQYPPSIVLSKVKNRIDSFTTTPDSLQFTVSDGYTSEDTAKTLVVSAEGYFSGTLPDKYLEETHPNLNFELIDLEESFFFKNIQDGLTTISVPTRSIDATYTVTLKEGLTHG